MSRIIKFRAWDIDKERMDYNNEFAMSQILHPDGFIVMQFTGLKDIEDHEIFEGDILKGWSGLDIVEVRYISAGFWFINRGKALQTDIEPTRNTIKDREYKIIGNIYENPSLTEEKGQSTEVRATSEAYKPIPAIQNTFKKILQLEKRHDNHNPLHADHCVNCQELNQLINAHNTELLNERERIIARGEAFSKGKFNTQALDDFLAELKEGGE